MRQNHLNSLQTGERLFSLDFFRGFTMFLLIAEFTHLFSFLISSSLEGSLVYNIGMQFHHHPWHGLRFWDLVQPYFMFIVGVAIPFSFASREKRGLSQSKILNHTLIRAFLLLFFGWALYFTGPGPGMFRFQNVLAQLSVTYLIAFLVMNKSARTQLIISFALLALTEVIYRFFPVEGFNHPFVANENFGTWLDLQYGGADLTGHWVSFNAIPTTAHTIWGVLAGQLLMSKKPEMEKLKVLVIAGVAGVVLGYALDLVTPIIKRISTSSFVVVTGGWTLLTLAFSYWLIDIKKQKKWSLFFAIVGLNPLFIYLFAHVGGAELIGRVIHPFTLTLFGWSGELIENILASLVVLLLMWYICYWLYRKKIFIKI